MKKIPFKNYITLLLILVVSVFAVLYLVKWYKDATKQTSIISELVSEIKTSELDNYVIENPDFVIYISDKENNNCRSYEKKLKKFLIEKNLTREFIYIDSKEISNSYLEELVNKYYDKNNNIKLSDVMIIIFENQKIKNVFTKDDADEEDFEVTKDFLKLNGVY